MEPLDLINFSKLCSYFGVSRKTIGQKRIPKKYKEQVNELEDVLSAWMDKNKKAPKNEA